MWPPLKDFAPVLIDTINSTLWLKYSITFPEHNIILDNQPKKDIDYYLHCNYGPKTPLCPNFRLGDIIKYTPNAYQSYARIAKTGAVININVNVNCTLPLFRHFDSTIDCVNDY